jgi:uncharacterized protein YcbK (DUF882 family)
MSVCEGAAHRSPRIARLLRGTALAGITGLFLVGANQSLQTAVAEGDTRTISFHHMHTGEDITITYKRDGRYDEAALKKLDWFMRDWRKEEEVHMDPHLFDLLWETYREVDGTQPIQVVCGYRSPATNAMLRARSTGVAQFSQHTEGHAMDFYIPGVPLEKIRIVGLRLQRGGVGFYPTSGSPFVHLDTGAVRHWPRMTHDQLAKVFPDGRTVHIPSDGQPLANYALALADVESHGAMPSAMSLETAREHGIDTSSAGRPTRSLLARIFGPKQDDEERGDEQAAAAPAPKRARTPTVVASLAPPPTRVAVERIVPMPMARPQQTLALAAAAMPKPRPQIVTPSAVPATQAPTVFDNRGYWRGAVEVNELPPITTTGTFETASLEPAAANALAYATPEAPRPALVQPMGATAVPSQQDTSATVITQAASTTAVKPPLTSARSSLTGTTADPWLRAAMLTPSVNDYMTATRLGAFDPRELSEQLHKPSMSVTMAFAAEPHDSIATDRFSGPAVVFLATTTFARQTTAAVTNSATALR